MGPAKNKLGNLIRRTAICAPSIIGAILIAIIVYGSYRHGLRNAAQNYLRSGVSHAGGRDHDDAVADFSEAIRIDSLPSPSTIADLRTISKVILSGIGGIR